MSLSNILRGSDDETDAHYSFDLARVTHTHVLLRVGVVAAEAAGITGQGRLSAAVADWEGRRLNWTKLTVFMARRVHIICVYTYIIHDVCGLVCSRGQLRQRRRRRWWWQWRRV